LVADDSEIWRKYQSLMAKNARDRAYFSPGGHFIKRKGRRGAKTAKKSDSFVGWIRRSRNPPDIQISVQYAALLHPTYKNISLRPLRLRVFALNKMPTW